MVAKATRVYDAHGIEDGEDNRIFSKSILVMTRNVGDVINIESSAWRPRSSKPFTW